MVVFFFLVVFFWLDDDGFFSSVGWFFFFWCFDFLNEYFLVVFCCGKFKVIGEVDVDCDGLVLVILREGDWCGLEMLWSCVGEGVGEVWEGRGGDLGVGGFEDMLWECVVRGVFVLIERFLNVCFLGIMVELNKFSCKDEICNFLDFIFEEIIVFEYVLEIGRLERVCEFCVVEWGRMIEGDNCLIIVIKVGCFKEKYFGEVFKIFLVLVL